MFKLKHLAVAAVAFLAMELPANAQLQTNTTPANSNEQAERQAIHFYRKVTLSMGAGNLNSVAGQGNTPQSMTALGKIYSLTAPISSATGVAKTFGATLPPNTFNISATGNGSGVGKVLHVRIYGTTAANGNTKVVNFKFGSTTVVLLNAAANNKDIFAEITVYPTAVNAQQINVGGYANAAIFNALGATSAQANNAAIDVAVNLPTSTGAADVVITGLEIYGESYNP